MVARVVLLVLVSIALIGTASADTAQVRWTDAEAEWVAISVTGNATAEHLAISGTRDASGGTAAVSPFGNASDGHLVASLTGDATADTGCFRVNCVALGAAVSGTGESRGTHAVAGLGHARAEPEPCAFAVVQPVGVAISSLCLASGGAASGTGDATTDCARTSCFAVSAGGDAITSCASVPCPAVSGSGDSDGSISVAPLGNSTARTTCVPSNVCNGGLAVGAGDATCESSTCAAASLFGDAEACTFDIACQAVAVFGTCGGGPCQDVALGDASGNQLALALGGDASCAGSHCVAAAPTGTSTCDAAGCVAFSLTDEAQCGAYTCLAASGTGGATSCRAQRPALCPAASAAGDSSGGTALSTTGDADGSRSAAAATGNASGGNHAASLTGDATSGENQACNAGSTDPENMCVAASGTGDATSGPGTDRSCGWAGRNLAIVRAGCAAVSITGDATNRAGDSSCGAPDGHTGVLAANAVAAGCIAVSGTGDARQDVGPNSCGTAGPERAQTATLLVGAGCIGLSAAGSQDTEARVETCVRTTSPMPPGYVEYCYRAGEATASRGPVAGCVQSGRCPEPAEAPGVGS